VVLTSSMAAVTDEPIKGKVFDENDWNQKSTLSRNPYYLSKTLAERAAWKFVEELPADKKMKLVVINVSVPFSKSPSFFVCLEKQPTTQPTNQSKQ